MTAALTLTPTVAALYESWQLELSRCHALGLSLIALAATGSGPDYHAAKAFYEEAQLQKEKAFEVYRLALRASCGPDPSAPAQERVLAAYTSDGCPCMREIEAPTGVRRRRDHEDITGVPNEEMR